MPAELPTGRTGFHSINPNEKRPAGNGSSFDNLNLTRQRQASLVMYTASAAAVNRRGA
jgi:hypothetical protein